jgi:sec-independent protein translocase protein TatA
MNALFLFLGLGVTEGLLIFGAVLLLFGGRKIPELMRGLGKGMREFNDARSTVGKEFREGMKEQPTILDNPPVKKEVENS